jgi:hypothetical protein
VKNLVVVWIPPWRWDYWGEPGGARHYFWTCIPGDSDGLWWGRFFGFEIAFFRPQHKQR